MVCDCFFFDLGESVLSRWKRPNRECFAHNLPQVEAFTKFLVEHQKAPLVLSGWMILRLMCLGSTILSRDRIDRIEGH